MAKKSGRFALSILIGAATGVGLYLYEKNRQPKPVAADDADDLDDFDEDLDDDFSDAAAHQRISIDLDNAKEKIGEKVIETLDKTKECIEQINVTDKIDKAKEIINDKMVAPASKKAEYTEMDMNTSVSNAYSDDADSLTEDFFDDTSKN